MSSIRVIDILPNMILMPASLVFRGLHAYAAAARHISIFEFLAISKINTANM